MKKIALAALVAAKDYALSPPARKLEIALLSGIGVAVVDAVKAAFGL